jgi:hypothetical protein
VGKKGGSTSTTTVDKQYNDRMATIAEQQQAMANDYYDYYKNTYQPYEAAQIESNMELLPGQTELNKQTIAANTALIPQQQQAASEFYTQALEGVNVADRMNQAKADVVQSMKGALEQNRRTASRSGINPNSALYMKSIQNTGLDTAKAIASARTNARANAETENFQRVATAATAIPAIGGNS